MSLYKRYLYLLFFSLAVTITFFIGGGGKNMLLVGTIVVSPFFFVTRKVKKDAVVKSFLLFLLYLCISSIINYSVFRASSFVYTFLLVISFILLYDAIQKDFFKLSEIINLVKKTIYAYALVLLIQQFCVAFHIPVVNQFLRFENSWKLASLALEPSHLPRFVFFLQYAYVSLKECSNGEKYGVKHVKEDWLVWFSYFWCMLTCGSITALLFLPLIFLKGVKIKIAHIVALAFIVLCSFGVLCNMATVSPSAQRIVSFLNALVSFSPEKINAADHSAAYRIIPFFVFIEKIDLVDVHFWLGYGLDVGRSICQKYMLHLSYDATYDGQVNIGGMMAFIIDYGIFFIVLLWKSVWAILKKCRDKLIVWVWCAFSLVESINMQMFWFSLLMFVFVTHFKKEIPYENS